MLTKRLAACAALVTTGGVACDVGTDHAYLAAELLQNGTCRHVIASDIGEGPLEAARRTIEQKGLTAQATLLLSDGLEQVPEDGVTDVIIAGMGAETMVQILSGCDWIRKNGVNLVLQPMTKAPVLRRWLSEEGFWIRQERVVSEGKFFYTVIQVQYAPDKAQKLSDSEAELGLLDWSDPTAQAYAAFRKRHYETLAAQMAAAAPEQAQYYAALCETLTGVWTKGAEVQ